MKPRISNSVISADELDSDAVASDRTGDTIRIVVALGGGAVADLNGKIIMVRPIANERIPVFGFWIAF